MLWRWSLEEMRGETVTAALQTQTDRRSLQLHLDQLYPQQRKH